MQIFPCYQHGKDRLKAMLVQFRFLGSEDSFIGIVDLSEMKAKSRMIWEENTNTLILGKPYR